MNEPPGKLTPPVVGSRPKAEGVLDEPRSGRLAAWGNAWLGGIAAPDHAAREDLGAGRRASDLGGARRDGASGSTLGLGRLRALGVTGLRLALPRRPPAGPHRPAGFNDGRWGRARQCLDGGRPALGRVPEVRDTGPGGELHVGVEWQARRYGTGAGRCPALGEAERELAEALRDATEALAHLDVAGTGPAAQAALGAYRARAERGREVLAPGYPPRAVAGGWRWRSGWAPWWR